MLSIHEITFAPGQLWRSAHMEKSYLSKAGYTNIEQRVTQLSKLPGQKKADVKSNRQSDRRPRQS